MSLIFLRELSVPFFASAIATFALLGLALAFFIAITGIIRRHD